MKKGSLFLFNVYNCNRKITEKWELDLILLKCAHEMDALANKGPFISYLFLMAYEIAVKTG